MLILEVRVTPQAGRVSCVLLPDNKIAISLIAPPEKGKANKELITFLSKKLRVPKGCIHIVSGETVRYKRVQIDADISFEQVLQALGLPYQSTLL